MQYLGKLYSVVLTGPSSFNPLSYELPGWATSRLILTINTTMFEIVVELAADKKNALHDLGKVMRWALRVEELNVYGLFNRRYLFDCLKGHESADIETVGFIRTSG